MIPSPTAPALPPLPSPPPATHRSEPHRDAAVLRDFARLCRASLAHEQVPDREAAELVLEGAAAFAEQIADQLQRGRITAASAADTLEASR
jgi:hypothetical protein